MGGNSDSGPQPTADQVETLPPRKRESITISYEARDYLASILVDPALRPGARRAVLDCVRVHPNERVVLVVESDHDHIAAAILQEAESRGAEVVAFIVSEGQAHNEPFVNRLVSRLAEADVSFLICSVGGLPVEFRRKVLGAGGARRRHAHMVGITEAMMQQSMRAPYDEVEAQGERLAQALSAGGLLHVATSTGTDVTIRCSSRYPWINASGILRRPGWTNLPGGEVFTTPVSVDGVVVADGGVWLPGGGELPRSARLKLCFEDGLLVGTTGVEEAISEPFLELLDGADNGRRVGQVGFGSNVGVLAAIGELLQDLKMPGFHLTLGYSCPDLTHAPFSCELEVPILVRRPHVTLDDNPLMVRGRYATALLHG